MSSLGHPERHTTCRIPLVYGPRVVDGVGTVTFPWLYSSTLKTRKSRLPSSLPEVSEEVRWRLIQQVCRQVSECLFGVLRVPFYLCLITVVVGGTWPARILSLCFDSEQKQTGSGTQEKYCRLVRPSLKKKKCSIFETESLQLVNRFSVGRSPTV